MSKPKRSSRPAGCVFLVWCTTYNESEIHADMISAQTPRQAAECWMARRPLELSTIVLVTVKRSGRERKREFFVTRNPASYTVQAVHRK